MRDVLSDFLKNSAVVGGFLILATGATPTAVYYLMRHPLSSSHPYVTQPTDAGGPTADASLPLRGVVA